MQISTTQQSTITRKGQVTIPVAIREALGLEEGDKIDFIMDKNKRVELLPRGSVVAQTAGIVRAKQPVLSAKELRRVAEEAIAEDVIRRSQ
jgi:antitoxin PrlF